MARGLMTTRLEIKTILQSQHHYVSLSGPRAMPSFYRSNFFPSFSQKRLSPFSPNRNAIQVSAGISVYRVSILKISNKSPLPLASTFYFQVNIRSRPILNVFCVASHHLVHLFLSLYFTVPTPILLTITTGLGHRDDNRLTYVLVPLSNAFFRIVPQDGRCWVKGHGYLRLRRVQSHDPSSPAAHTKALGSILICQAQSSIVFISY